jgi:hypothetical protein
MAGKTTTTKPSVDYWPKPSPPPIIKPPPPPPVKGKP